MRVIGGKYKGKKLIQPLDKETRPLKDLVKESILNNLVKTATMDLQVAQYTNTITSDTGTDLHASKTAHGASIESDIATTLETRAKEKKTTLRTKTADASITTTSHVITLR